MLFDRAASAISNASLSRTETRFLKFQFACKVICYCLSQTRFPERLNVVNREPSNGQKFNRQPSNKGKFYRQSSKKQLLSD